MLYLKETLFNLCTPVTEENGYTKDQPKGIPASERGGSGDTAADLYQGTVTYFLRGLLPEISGSFYSCSQGNPHVFLVCNK